MKNNFVKSAFTSLSKKELFLYIGSLVAVCLCFVFSKEKDPLTLVSSILGISGAFFVGKGMIFGQYCFVIFSIFYGLVSIKFRYFSEIITYLFMNTPIAIAAIITWMKHPYEETAEVEVSHMNGKSFSILFALTAIVTIAFYFVLKALKTNNLIVSTISITTSFAASALEVLRSSYYAVFFMLNDIVLIVLWSYAALKDPSFFPMASCFVIFLVNDCFGFWNWQKMKKRQKTSL